MVDGFSTDLCIAALTVCICAWLVARRCVSGFVAALLSCIKVSIPFVYFAAFRTEQWNFLDDLSYTRLATDFLHRGFSPLSLLVSPNGPDAMASAANGWHIGYIWFNVFAQYVFGEHYYAPVFLNVALTFVAGWLLYRIMIVGMFAPAYGRAFFCFFLFQPELLAWSSFINLKDILVMTLTIGLCYSSLMLSKQLSIRHLLLLLGYVVVLRFLRFYVPLVFFAAVVTWYLGAVCSAAKFHRHVLRIVIPVGTVFSIALMVPSARERTVAMAAGLGLMDLSFYRNEYLQFSLYGCLRWLTTPRPWAISSDSSFQLIPSLLHWTMMLPALIGGVYLWRSGKAAKLCLIYFAMAIVLYGAFELEQSPRHRLQVTFVIAWLQFHALWIATHRSSYEQLLSRSGTRSITNESTTRYYGVVPRRRRNDARTVAPEARQSSL